MDILDKYLVYKIYGKKIHCVKRRVLLNNQTMKNYVKRLRELNVKFEIIKNKYIVLL